MVKRMVWNARAVEETPEGIDGTLRKDGADLPAGLPAKYWVRGFNSRVELSSEAFPGSTPVWLWEE